MPSPLRGPRGPRSALYDFLTTILTLSLVCVIAFWLSLLLLDWLLPLAGPYPR